MSAEFRSVDIFFLFQYDYIPREFRDIQKKKNDLKKISHIKALEKVFFSTRARSCDCELGATSLRGVGTASDDRYIPWVRT